MAKNKPNHPAKKNSARPKPVPAPAKPNSKARTPDAPADKSSLTMEKPKPSKKSALRDSILARKAAAKPIAFSLDEVRAIAKVATAKADSVAKATKVAAKPAMVHAPLEKPAKPNHIKA